MCLPGAKLPTHPSGAGRQTLHEAGIMLRSEIIAQKLGKFANPQVEMRGFATFEGDMSASPRCICPTPLPKKNLDPLIPAGKPTFASLRHPRAHLCSAAQPSLHHDFKSPSGSLVPGPSQEVERARKASNLPGFSLREQRSAVSPGPLK